MGIVFDTRLCFGDMVDVCNHMVMLRRGVAQVS